MKIKKHKGRFQYGDIVVFMGGTGKFAAKTGKALAQVVGYEVKEEDKYKYRAKEWLKILWIRNGDDKGQSDGNYEPEQFALLLRPRI